MASQQPNGERIASSPFFKSLLGKAEGYLKQPLRIKQLVNDAYQKASEKNDVGTIAHEAWESMQTLFRLIKAAASGEYTGIPTPTILGAIAVLIYFLSPIDLVPDFIPVVGLLDDVALMAWFMSTLKTEIDHFHEWESTRPATAASANVPAEKWQPTTDSKAPVRLLEKAEHSVSSGSFDESTDSAKRAGKADLPGGSSPDPANPAEPHHPTIDVTPNPNVTGASVAGSRDPKDPGIRGGDTGGNVR
ncbi:DUF1232 domain-containing protein [Hymenobacter busanensis]|uniref:DUF1232 domain-containing protein n=1 Tax=Hymenobacter busanensis TaxID=2607656 RepID=A0A7L5A0Z3_9BACT|nr:YkvA family protein [Hymenobacter busanensis]KAA9331501.1 DUF1232 domain-containing protein [Hymenobacter busanensis]QHJ08655.1 DUF1232 domain-containing protein [Hymenobacter busanensis]